MSVNDSHVWLCGNGVSCLACTAPRAVQMFSMAVTPQYVIC